jgi:hypothetical protein
MEWVDEGYVGLDRSDARPSKSLLRSESDAVGPVRCFPLHRNETSGSNREIRRILTGSQRIGDTRHGLRRAHRVSWRRLYENRQKRDYRGLASLGDESYSGHIRQQELPDAAGSAAQQ